MQPSQVQHSVLRSNIEAIAAIAAAVKTTLGPAGLDTMLVDEFGNSTCTNDGVTILENIIIQHPVAKLAVEIAKAQEAKVGDGTTSIVVVLERLLETSYRYIEQGMSPNRIARSIEVATTELIKEFKTNSRDLTITSQTLIALIKVAARGDSTISSLVHKALLITAEKNGTDYISNAANSYLEDTITTSSLIDSQVLDGFLIKKKPHFNYPKQYTQAPILIIEGAFEPEPISTEAISTNEGVKRFQNNIEYLQDTAKQIIKTGARIIVTNSSMFPNTEEIFAQENILVLTHLTKNQLQTLAHITGAKPLLRSQLRNDPINTALGNLSSAYFHEDLGGYVFKGKAHYRPTIVLNAQTETVLAEQKRICSDASKVAIVALKEGYLLGEGVAELNLVSTLKNKANQEGPYPAAGFNIMADALTAVFEQILENAGFEAQTYYKNINFNSQNTRGVDLNSGAVINLEDLCIFDATAVKISIYKIASEITSQILRINKLIPGKC